MPADQQTPGEEQEARVRSRLVAEGYEQPYGASDDEIRRNLGFRGKCADFVGYHPKLDRWLIAESKGSDLWSAEIQLANTLTALLDIQVVAKGMIELHIYTKPSQYSRLRQEPHGTGGYYREGDFLGTKPDGINFKFAHILGYRIRIFKEIGDEQQSTARYA
ncbi:MAG TPA: hypothetical protein VGE45_13945 [Chloroflexia bacterium]|jgi:hypothetical protein